MKIHQPCPKCNSSDACTIWPDGGWYCHSCEGKGKDYERILNSSSNRTSSFSPVRTDVSYVSITTSPANSVDLMEEDKTKSNSNAPQYIVDTPISKSPYRGLEVKTLKDWSIRGPDDKGHYYFPLYINGSQVNFKVNQPEVEKQKYTYHTKGFKQTDYELWGMHVPAKSTKACTIVFGMWDAPSLYQMLGGYPVYAVQSDTVAIESIQKNFEKLNQFETIKILTDNDEAGKKVDLQKIATIFPGKVEVVELPDDFPKDANEALTKGKASELIKRWWASQPVKLKAFVDLTTLKDEVFSNTKLDFKSYPWPSLNKHCWGWLYGTLDLFLAGSSIGKSLFMAEHSRHILNTTGDHQAIFFLEDSIKKSTLRYMSLASGIPFQKPDEDFTDKDIDEAWQTTLGTNRLHIFDQREYGTLNTKGILSLIELAAVVLGCRVIVLDHISYIISSNAAENTLALTQEFITELRQLAGRLDIYIFTCCHLRKNTNGKSWEQGAIPTMEDAYGSGAMYQLPSNIFSLSRNKMAENLDDRDTTGIHVNKARESGFSGHACDVKFTMRPYKLVEVENM